MSIERLKDRAHLLQKARHFFHDRGLIEVDCQALQPYPAIDTHVDVIEAEVAAGLRGYLHTSPEYQMKRLISAGIGEIFYLGHVFRKGDLGVRHQPEFTMAEWYRIGFSLQEMIQETAEFLFLLLPRRSIEILSYREAFSQFAGIDYTRIPLAELQKLVTSHGGNSWDRATSLQFLLSHLIEPKLGVGKLTALTDYPPTEAALARLVSKEGEEVALRFELYWEGVEMANGYHESADATQLKERFSCENQRRKRVGKEPYPIDTPFLQALEQGFPDCCGVSVGFDRALMLRSQAATLGAVTAISTEWQ